MEKKQRPTSISQPPEPTASRRRLRSGSRHDATPYKHNTLNDPSKQIRLLKLLPGSDNSAISCEIVAVDFPATIPYHALSYEWGDPSIQRSIFIGGKLLRIRSNLWNFLWQLRSLRCRHSAITLWCDAICINQTLKFEVNLQIPLMRQIYQNARSTIAWLGEAEPEADEFFPFMLDCYEKWNLHTVAVPYKDNMQLRSVEGSKLLNQWFQNPDFGFKQWNFLYTMLNRSFWRRAWIVQEIVLSREIDLFWGKHSLVGLFSTFITFCGYGRLWHSTQGTLIKFAPDHLNPVRPLDGTAAWGIVLLRHEREANLITRVYSLPVLLQQFSGQECSVAHDFVYAFLGLVSEEGVSENFHIDYESPLLSVLVEAILSSALAGLNMLRSLVGKFSLSPDCLSQLCQNSESSNKHDSLLSSSKELSEGVVSFGIISEVHRLQNDICSAPSYRFRVNESQERFKIAQVWGLRPETDDEAYGVAATMLILFYRRTGTDVRLVSVGSSCHDGPDLVETKKYHEAGSRGLLRSWSNPYGHKPARFSRGHATASVSLNIPDLAIIAEIEPKEDERQW